MSVNEPFPSIIILQRLYNECYARVAAVTTLTIKSFFYRIAQLCDTIIAIRISYVYYVCKCTSKRILEQLFLGPVYIFLCKVSVDWSVTFRVGQLLPVATFFMFIKIHSTIFFSVKQSKIVLKIITYERRNTVTGSCTQLDYNYVVNIFAVKQVRIENSKYFILFFTIVCCLTYLH